LLVGACKENVLIAHLRGLHPDVYISGEAASRRSARGTGVRKRRRLPARG
jgi:hypothetical protein